MKSNPIDEFQTIFWSIWSVMNKLHPKNASCSTNISDPLSKIYLINRCFLFNPNNLRQAPSNGKVPAHVANNILHCYSHTSMMQNMQNNISCTTFHEGVSHSSVLVRTGPCMLVLRQKCEAALFGCAAPSLV